MPKEENKSEHFLIRLLRFCLEEDSDPPVSPDGVSDKEFLAAFVFLVVAVAFLELTIGPFSLLK